MIISGNARIQGTSRHGMDIVEYQHNSHRLLNGTKLYYKDQRFFVYPDSKYTIPTHYENALEINDKIIFQNYALEWCQTGSRHLKSPEIWLFV